MKNKLFLIALAVLLVMAFTACQNGVQDVKVQYDKANEVASVTATLTTNTTGNKYVILTWDAVEDASGYGVYYKRGADKRAGQIGGVQAQNFSTVAVADNGIVTWTANDDPDKWSALISVSGGVVTGKSYTFGVLTYPFVQNGTVLNSDIVWAPNAITAP
jgi:hypothetical protein